VVVFRVAKSEDSQALIVDINGVQSIYLKDNVQGILDWINKDSLRVAVDKERGFSYLSSASYNSQQEIDKKNLSRAAKVIKEFENLKLSEENLRQLCKDLVSEKLQPLGLPLLSVKKMIENPTSSTSTHDTHDNIPAVPLLLIRGITI
jgi:hypothetical protein